MQPITPASTWPFTAAWEVSGRRRAEEGYTRWFSERTGRTVNAIHPAVTPAYLMSHGVDLATSLVLDHGTNAFVRRTGERLVMDSVASGSGLLNRRTGTFEDEILADVGVREWQPPEVVSCTRAAPLTGARAALLGLRARSRTTRSMRVVGGVRAGRRSSFWSSSESGAREATTIVAAASARLAGRRWVRMPSGGPRGLASSAQFPGRSGDARTESARRQRRPSDPRAGLDPTCRGAPRDGDARRREVRAFSHEPTSNSRTGNAGSAPRTVRQPVRQH